MTQLILEQALNGLQFGLMLFLLAAGLTLVFGIMNFVNLSHGSFYMMGAYFAAATLARTDSFLLAGLAGVVGGNTYVTEPAMAGAVGPLIFVVVVVGGMGSLAGAFLASLLIGIIQTFAVAMDYSLATALQGLGVAVTDQTFGYPLLKLTISQVAPILPYLFLVLILIFRPKGLLGTRED